ncbi:MAG: hypothetical protein AAGA20_24015 [Planctomycetota bacterium]
MDVAPTAFTLLAAAVLASSHGESAAGRSKKLADRYVAAIESVNREHARKPRDTTEDELAGKIPKRARGALEDLLDLEKGDELASSLARCARAALDLDLVEDFDACREALAALEEDAARELGLAHSAPRVLVLGEGGLDADYLAHFAEVADDILAAYDELFAFDEFSKVPGKKLRIRVHLEPRIDRPPHFAPQFPWHSEVDFPVVDPSKFTSPTQDGKFLFYGLCHEFGHVIAMWGDRTNEEDHHAWGHYTGVALVEHFAEADDPPDWLEACRDVRWRSIEKERERLADVEPGRGSRDAVLALLIALHDEVGTRAMGSALNALDRDDEELRINFVRYYALDDFGDALKDEAEGKKQRKRIEALFEAKR